ncbi:MAG: alpha/beta hydrolase [Microbacterium sp.]|nr:alpha/beta hydrolase [Microbacterium sp.]
MRVDDLALPFALSTLGGATDEPTIILPGGPCRGPEYLGDFAGLGEAHSFVVLHPRGTPLSGGLSRGWWTDAEDVVALADALELPRVNLIGHSAGTRLTLATAARFPDRVASMALVTPPATWLSGTPYDGGSLTVERTQPAVADAIRSLEHDESDTEEAFRETFLRQAPATYAHWTAREQVHAAVGAMSLAAAEAWFTDIPDDAADRIRSTALPPTLVIGGAQDLLTGVGPVVDYAALLGAELRMIDDCGHYPWIEQPEAFRTVLDAWLTGRTGRSERR